MQQGSFDKEWSANKWLIRASVVMGNALLGVLVFMGNGILQDTASVKNSSADILNRQIKMEVQQQMNNGRIIGLEKDFKDFQKEYYLNAQRSKP